MNTMKKLLFFAALMSMSVGCIQAAAASETKDEKKPSEHEVLCETITNEVAGASALDAIKREFLGYLNLSTAEIDQAIRAGGSWPDWLKNSLVMAKKKHYEAIFTDLKIPVVSVTELLNTYKAQAMRDMAAQHAREIDYKLTVLDEKEAKRFMPIFQSVLEKNRTELPITLRQIHYVSLTERNCGGLGISFMEEIALNLSEKTRNISDSVCGAILAHEIRHIINLDSIIGMCCNLHIKAQGLTNSTNPSLLALGRVHEICSDVEGILYCPEYAAAYKEKFLREASSEHDFFKENVYPFATAEHATSTARARYLQLIQDGFSSAKVIQQQTVANLVMALLRQQYVRLDPIQSKQKLIETYLNSIHNPKMQEAVYDIAYAFHRTVRASGVVPACRTMINLRKMGQTTGTSKFELFTTLGKDHDNEFLFDYIYELAEEMSSKGK